MTAKIIDFNEHANDLHLSEWCGLIKLTVADLEAAALKHETAPDSGSQLHVLELIEQVKSLLGAAQRTVRKGSKPAGKRK